MLFNRREFDACLALRGITIDELGLLSGLGKSKIYRRLKSNGKDFTLEEIESIVSSAKFTIPETNRVFFNVLVA